MFNISLTSGVKITYSFVKCGCLIYFFLNSANLICRGTYISKYFRDPLDFKIARVDCTSISLISPWKHLLWCSLEAPHWGASNEYSQHMFSWRNKKKYYVMTPPPLLSNQTVNGQWRPWSDWTNAHVYLGLVTHNGDVLGYKQTDKQEDHSDKLQMPYQSGHSK